MPIKQATIFKITLSRVNGLYTFVDSDFTLVFHAMFIFAVFSFVVVFSNDLFLH